jgi:PrtD family type I secretion system ABC transporter
MYGMVLLAMPEYFRSSTFHSPSPRRGELGSALRACRWAIIAVGVFTAFINVLALSGSIFMLEVYNRVLPSRSLPTLAVLCVFIVLLLGCQGLLDLIRARLLVRIGTYLHERTCERAFRCLVTLPVKFGPAGLKMRPIGDLDSVRSFLSGPGPAALFDLPWIPVYLALLFIFHAYLGMVALAGALMVVSLTLLTEALSRGPLGRALGAAQDRDNLAELSRRNGETIVALGMNGHIAQRWRSIDQQMCGLQSRASDIALGLGAVARTLRHIIQSAMLAVGAVLVIQQQATGGLIVAGAILAARALAPIDVAIAHWRGFIGARQSWRRLSAAFAIVPNCPEMLALPAPKGRLSVEQITVIPPGGQAPVLHEVSFALRAGDAIGVVGSSASGKSSLARAVVGVWAPVKGAVRLDGARLDQWTPEDLGVHVGYLAQHVELLPGTIAENICRFDPAPCTEQILKAAEAADVHDLIISFPEGYQTRIGPGTATLSQGQQQRLALARALYREPFLVVLDEPNASLDTEGEAALSRAIGGVRERGGVVVVISHRQSALMAVSHILMLRNGQVQGFGLRDEVLRQKPRVVVAAHNAGTGA